MRGLEEKRNWNCCCRALLLRALQVRYCRFPACTSGIPPSSEYPPCLSASKSWTSVLDWHAAATRVFLACCLVRCEQVQLGRVRVAIDSGANLTSTTSFDFRPRPDY
jgi:hypothetical protein